MQCEGRGQLQGATDEKKPFMTNEGESECDSLLSERAKSSFALFTPLRSVLLPKKIAGRTSHLLTPGVENPTGWAENPTGWAKTAGPQTDDHSSVKSYPISILFSLEDSLVNLQLKGYKKIPPHLAYV